MITTLYGCSTIRINESEKKPFDISVGQEPKRYLIGDNSDIIDYLIDTDDLDSKLIRAGTMTVKMVTDNKVRLSFNIGNEKIEKTFKGRLVSKEFKLRNRLKVKLYPPIYWALIDDSATLFKNNDNELVIAGGHGGAIFLTLMPIFGTTSESRTRIFEEID